MGYVHDGGGAQVVMWIIFMMEVGMAVAAW